MPNLNFSFSFLKHERELHDLESNRKARKTALDGGRKRPPRQENKKKQKQDKKDRLFMET